MKSVDGIKEERIFHLDYVVTVSMSAKNIEYSMSELHAKLIFFLLVLN